MILPVIHLFKSIDERDKFKVLKIFFSGNLTDAGSVID